MSTFFKLFMNLIGYLLIASFFLLFVIICYFISLFTNKKLLKDHILSMPIFYAFISSTFLIVSTISFLFEGERKNLIFGRYIEPIIPIMVVVGIICLSNIGQKIFNKKSIIYFALISIPIVFIMPYIFAWDNIIINVFNDLQDNPTLYAYKIFYGYPASNAFTIFYEPNFAVPTPTISSYLLPSLLMSVYFLATIALIILSMKNNHYISLLLVFILISSLISSTILYQVTVAKSNAEMNNDIARFLTNNTNDKTIYLIDRATTPTNVNIEIMFMDSGIKATLLILIREVPL